MQTAPSSKRAPAKFYQQDIVQRIAPPHTYGIVLRCWHDAEDLPPDPIDPLIRPLNHGEVGVSFLGDGGERNILPESELRLVDRTLNAGDYCKRHIDDVSSGVVTNLHVLARVEHAITGEKADGWWTTNELWNKTEADIGDYVIYDDWIGQVVEVFDESVVELTDGQLVRIRELGSHLHVGERGSDVLPPPSGGVQNFIGYLLGGPSPTTSGTVVAVKHSVYAIAWLALNQSLSPVVIENKQRPQRLWAGEDISKLTLIHGRADKVLRVGDRVCFKDPDGKPSSTHSQGGENMSVITVQTFVVIETATMLDVLWQDGSRETSRSTDVIPYINPDEYDCWPGDHVFWKNEDGKRAAIIQSVNAADRTALILLADTRTLETVSVLELDPHGAYEPNSPVAQAITDGFGIHRSDFVFIHPPGSTNGFQPPYVPKLGELEAWVAEGTVYGCQFKGWRKEMAEMGSKIADQRSYQASVNESARLPHPPDATLHWIGEVTELNLDGTVEVIHPDLSIKTYPLERLTRLYDGMEQLEDQSWGDDASERHNSENEEVWTMDEDGKWQSEDVHDLDWEDEDNIGDAIDDDEWKGENDTETIERDGQQIVPQPVAQSIRMGSSSTEVANSSEDRLELTSLTMDGSTMPSTGSDEGSWKRFDVLSSAPVDHAFYSTIPATPSKTFFSRLKREFHILASSLPDSILVRAYEDRTDLLRSLIIGPENTPYEDAPFVIDWMLDSNFPHSPPIAHFHSWTNGNGRVNPNLYEEGKVCLSILGTWAGDRHETWSATRSLLLQVLVSIQGLVLVKEPWFCEPAYEKLRGTEEGIVNSRLYSEKAYVLSRGFVRRALEVYPGSLESEISWLYYTQGRLGKVLNDAQALIAKSKSTLEAEADSGLAVPRLTTGGIIMLERTLSKLQGLLDSHQTN